MPKNKLHKYERVKALPNVVFSEFGKSQPPEEYPWYGKRYAGMEKVLELGCGKAEHSLAFSRTNADRIYVGVDSKSHRICVGAEKAMAEGLGNIFFLRAHIERIKEFFLANSIHEIWLTFPDPHPKKRSIKNRLTSPLFLDAYACLLAPRGRVCLKTDSDLLYTYTKDAVKRWGGQVITASENIHADEDSTSCAMEVVSAFEKAARSKGAVIKYMEFQL